MARFRQRCRVAFAPARMAACWNVDGTAHSIRVIITCAAIRLATWDVVERAAAGFPYDLGPKSVTHADQP